MADSASSSATLDSKPETSESQTTDLHSTQLDPSPPAHAPSSSSSSSSAAAPTHPVAENPTSNPPSIAPPHHSVQSFASSTISVGALPPPAPSFRPATPIPLSTPQFSPLPNPSNQNPNFQSPSIQNPNVQPPGVNPVFVMPAGMASGAGAVTVSMSPLRPASMYQVSPGQPSNYAFRPYPQMPNGFPTASMPTPPGTIPPPVS